MVLIPYYFSMKYNASIFLIFLRPPDVRGLLKRQNGGAPTQPTGPGQGGNHPKARSSETIAKPRIEFGQRVCSVLLLLNREIFPVAAYFAAAHLERFWIANIARMQNV